MENEHSFEVGRKERTEGRFFFFLKSHGNSCKLNQVLVKSSFTGTNYLQHWLKNKEQSVTFIGPVTVRPIDYAPRLFSLERTYSFRLKG